MATKITKKNPQKAITDELQDVNSAEQNILAEENKKLKEELEGMISNYKEMQLQLQNMMIANQAKDSQLKDEEITIGCRIFNGVTLSSPGGDITIPIGYREEAQVTTSELKDIFKNPFGYKNMFKKGIIYFEDEDNYKKFKITKEFDLSDENLIALLSSNTYNIIEQIKLITNDKKDLTQIYALIYQIAYLISHRKVDMDYDVRSQLEKYLGVEFSTLITNLNK